jgi:S-adenosylmethionine:tRNA ribosyltransferase-isomerase
MQRFKLNLPRLKMNPQELQIKDFTYQLPDERIARYPLAERDLSKLLVYNRGEIKEDVYKNISEYLAPRSTLVFNNTRVIPARLFFKNAHGALIEILCLEPAGATDMATAMAQTGEAEWQCMVGRASKWKEKTLELNVPGLNLNAQITAQNKDGFAIKFNWQPVSLTFAEVLEKAGTMPIPPYLHRESEPIDAVRYQTVYAQRRGSVAAPTAGLHFTDAVFRLLADKDIDVEYLTLHVGAGTFKPVKSVTIGEHEMHAEVVEVNRQTLEHLLQKAEEKAGPLVAVGTTSMRTLESLYWLGVKVLSNPAITSADLTIGQWDPYVGNTGFTSTQALAALLNRLQKNNMQALTFKTRIMIAPGYKPRMADGLVTNFHQPNSTLLLLIAALIGDDWKKVYDYALNHHFRFLSYGDGSLLMF